MEALFVLVAEAPFVVADVLPVLVVPFVELDVPDCVESVDVLEESFPVESLLASVDVPSVVVVCVCGTLIVMVPRPEVFASKLWFSPFFVTVTADVSPTWMLIDCVGSKVCVQGPVTDSATTLLPSTTISTQETLLSATVTTTSVFSGVVVVLEDVLSDFVLVVWEEVFEEELFVPEASELDEVELCELVVSAVETGTEELAAELLSPAAIFTQELTDITMMIVRRIATSMPRPITMFSFERNDFGRWGWRPGCGRLRSTFGRWTFAMFLDDTRPRTEFAAS